MYEKSPPLSGLGEGNAWLNYGGDKVWLAPQGWDNDQQWPGPPDSTLDGQSYALEIINPNIIRLTSKEDHRSGVQLSRTIKLFDGTTRVSIDATMKNIDTKPRRWGIWDHTQFNAGTIRISGPILRLTKTVFSLTDMRYCMVLRIIFLISRIIIAA